VYNNTKLTVHGEKNTTQTVLLD